MSGRVTLEIPLTEIQTAAMLREDLDRWASDYERMIPDRAAVSVTETALIFAWEVP